MASIGGRVRCHKDIHDPVGPNSVWDTVVGTALVEVLDTKAVVNLERLAAFLAQRTRSQRLMKSLRGAPTSVLLVERAAGTTTGVAALGGAGTSDQTR